MLDVHPPHAATHSWKDFFIHIATIVVGLLIAVGLEQTVEFFHHRHQRRQIEEQLLEVLHDNLAIDASDLRAIGAFRACLVELQASVVDRRHGVPHSSVPPPDDARMELAPVFPSLAPYDAAQQNGTVALLPSGEIRLYNRIAFQRGLLLTASQNWFQALTAWASFDQRFIDSSGSAGFGSAVAPPALDQLSPQELVEYQTLLANLTKQGDVLAERLYYFDFECRGILRGNYDENTLINDMLRRSP